MQGKTETWLITLVLITVVSIAGTLLYMTFLIKENLRISTTSSLYDTGLLEAIEKRFESDHPVDLQFTSRGTGLAIRLAKEGDTDMIMVHAPSEEQLFLQKGYGVCRKIIAYNFFAIVGPENDPAKITGLSAIDALKSIVEAGRSGTALWVSRGDESGTHIKEKELWSATDFTWENLRTETVWYREAGKKMGGTLIYTSETSGAYTLTDLATYLSYTNAGLIDLEVLVSQGKELLNVYSVIAVNPVRHPHTNFEWAINFTRFLVSEEGQQIIGEYGKDKYGQPLFYPTVKLLEENNDPVAIWIREYAFFNSTECPEQYRNNHPELYVNHGAEG